MKILIGTTAFFILALYSESCQSYAELTKVDKERSETSIRIVSEIYPPFQFLDENGQLRGLSADKVQAVFTRANIKYTTEVFPWVRAYQLALIEPNTFIYSLLRTDIRESLFQWIIPLCTIEFSFYRLKNRPDIQVNSMNDAKNYRTASQIGQASTEYLLDQGFETGKHLSVSYNNVHHIKMLVHGRVDLIVLSSSHVESLLLTEPPYINDIEATYPIDYLRNNVYLASNLDTSPLLIKKIRKAHSELADQFNPNCQE